MEESFGSVESFGEIESFGDSAATEDFSNETRETSLDANESLKISPAQNLSFGEIANFFVAIAIIVSAALSVIYVFVGGINFILSGGDEGKIKKAVHTIRYSIIGLVVTIFAVTIIAILGSILNFNLISYLSWSKITEMMNLIITRLTHTQLPSGF